MAKRWEEIASEFETAIKEGGLRPGDRLPGEISIAEQHGVCRMTVSRALAELQRRGMITRKPRQGTVVRERAPAPKGRVGLLFYHSSAFPQRDYIEGVRSMLNDDIDLLLCDSENEPRRELHHLAKLCDSTDGVICYPTCAPENIAAMKTFRDRGKPIICVDRYPDGLAVDAMVTDNYGSTWQALEATAAGKSLPRIGYVGFQKTAVSATRDRFRAYVDFVNAGGRFDDTLVNLFPKPAGYDLSVLVELVHEAFLRMRRTSPPSILFCEQDSILLCVLDVCERLEIVPQTDISIVSFNDSATLTPGQARRLTRLVQQPFELGRLAGGRLLDRFGGVDDAPRVLALPAHFHQPARSARLEPVGNSAVE